MERRAFMVMPFADEEAQQSYLHCVKPICDEYNITVRRADEIFTINPVYDDIVKEIREASLIIVDISGRNPNVFYELGIAHTLKQQQTVMITHDEYQDSPFDISHFRIIKYQNSIEGAEALKQNLRHTIQNIIRDIKLIFKDQLEIVFEVLTSSGKHTDMYALIGAADVPGVVHVFDKLYVEGHSPGNDSTHDFNLVQDGLSTFIKIGYAYVENTTLKLTDLGKAFVDFIKDKGFVCDIFNDHTIKRICTFQRSYRVHKSDARVVKAHLGEGIAGRCLLFFYCMI